MSNTGVHRVENVGSGMSSRIGHARRLARLSLVPVLVCAAITAVGAGSAFAAAPSVEEEFVLNVSSTSATLNAKINPGGSETSYRFEYGTSEAYGSRIPLSDRAVGFGSEGVSVASHVQGLEPSTTYHYRVLAVNAEGEEYGDDHTFTTEAAAMTPVTADGRQWELVSPATKDGALVEPISNIGSPIQAAADGNGMAFATTAPTEPNPEGSRSPEAAEFLAKREPTGWSSKDIQPQERAPDGLVFQKGQAYRLFSTDLSQGIVEPRGGTLLSPEATEQTLYLRDSLSGVFQPLLTAGNVAKGVKIAEESPESAELQIGSGQKFADATPDLSHIIMESAAPLTENAVKLSPEFSLYEWTSGQVKLVSILPDGTAAPTARLGSASPPSYATESAPDINMQNAVSSNGEYVVFTEFGAYPKPGHIYLRDLASEETVRLDVPQGGSASGSSEGGVYEDASSDGEHVFFTYDEQLTSDSHAQTGEWDLYEFSVEPGAKLSGRLTDLSVDPTNGEAADVQGVPGASEDGSHVYFVARGRLTNEPREGCIAELTATEREGEEKTQEGRCRAARGGDNLYSSTPNPANPRIRTTAFIATLAPADEHDWAYDPWERTSRVSPNGRYIAFMSDASLTGYDNRDASSDALDEEVYIYDAMTGRLSCASCDPTGARPAGVFQAPFKDAETGFSVPAPKYDSYRLWEGRWLAANVPAWTGMELLTAIYQSRYLSNDGRLFFNSSDALVPADTNGQVDVYEYNPAGVGSCSAGGASYSSRSGGCVTLVSSGTSSEESVFLDASESGGDVFILTSARLARKDYDSSYDVYDAHLCRSEAPCIEEASPVPACTTSDSCREAPGAQPSTFGPPASATFSGAGNVTPVGVSQRVAAKKKAKKVHKGSSRRKACRKKRGMRRAQCRSKVRRQSGASKSNRRVSEEGK